MHTPSRRLAPLAISSAAALSLALCAPGAAAARGTRHVDRSAHSASREAERASRAGERATAAEERRATREQERQARKAARAHEREVRRSARHRSAGEQAAEPSAGTGSEATGEGEANAHPPALQPAAPTGDEQNGNCSATLQVSSSRITAGETVTLFGKLTCPSGTSVAGQQITVYAGKFGAAGAGSEVAGTATSETDGSYQLGSLAPSANTTYRIRVGRHGAHVAVKVAPAVTLNGPSPAAELSTVGGRSFAAHTGKATFSGTVDPGSGDGRVALQVAYAATCEQWRTVAFAPVQSDGSYAVAHGFRTAGSVNVRVLVHMHGHNVVAASEPLAYEVAQVQNPKLTILSSATPIVSGQSATISGVAAAGAGETVTLLARTAHNGYATVATTTTGDGGAYSFAQTPAQSTSFRVSDATTKSAVLFEGVKRALTVDPVADSVPAGQSVAFTGTLAPADAGQTVYVERENASGIGFHIVASATVDGGAFSIARTFANAGAYVMRVRVGGDPAYQATTSAPFAFTVTPAAAAALTPEAPAAPPAPEA